MLQIGDAQIYLGNSLDVLKTLPDNSVDSIVTDPPYELGFMGKDWDNSGIAYNVNLWRECLRVLKSGGHLLAFSGTRTYHRMTVAIEDAGFEIRDMITWISNKTFPKSHNIGKAINKIDAIQAEQWQGWGTGLKPTVEPIVLARKPIDGTIAENVLKYGTGGLNIDASRIGTDEITINTFDNGAKPFGDAVGEPYTSRTSVGRYPANLVIDEATAEQIDQQSGITKSPKTYVRKADGFGQTSYGLGQSAGTESKNYGDEGGASRFFYVARASKSDRNEGLETSNTHPTVKPTKLMQYLIELVTPPNGTVLDPFTGSGSTGKAALLNGYKFIGIELTEEYLPIIKARLEYVVNQKGLFQ